MRSSSLDSTSVNRLKEILADRYGKSLQIRQLMDLSEVDVSKSFFTRGQDLHVPLRLNGAFLGTAIIPDANDLNKEKQEHVAQLVRLILEPGMYNWFLKQKEDNLTEISKAQLEFENLRLFGEPLPDIDEELKNTLDALRDAEKSDLITQLIHLEGSRETLNKKVALQLHEMTSRWAFVPFADIKRQLHSSQDISALGEVTIFIEGVEDLNAAEQELLTDYLNDHCTNEEPLIITTSCKPLDQLAAIPTLSDKLMDEISVNSFEVDKAPLTNQGLKEVLELFFLKDQEFDS